MTVAIAASIFAVLGLGCLTLILFGLPGTWALLLLAVLVEVLDEYWLGAPEQTFAWWLLGLALGLAVVGEAVDFLSGVLGTKTAGGTRKGMLGAFLGGMAGALMGSFLIPIPVVGTLLGALVGTFIGALVGEMKAEKEAKDALKPAIAATIGRALGTFFKAGIGVVVWSGLVVAAYIP